MKAPNASDSPLIEVSHAMPRQMTMIVSKKSSRLRLRTMYSSTFGAAYQAAAMIQPTSTTDFPTGKRMDESVSSPGLARIGVRRIMGTTARSWKIRMPMVARPCGASLSPLAASAFNTIAVLLSDNMKPQNSACGPDIPAMMPPSHTRTMTPLT